MRPSVLTRTHREALLPEDTLARSEILTIQPAMLHLLAQARQAGASEAPVLIEAERGSGAEPLARFIHAQSPRAAWPCVAIHCAALPVDFLESGLSRRLDDAFIEEPQSPGDRLDPILARTILLEEIGELNQGLQASLLRLLREREERRLGREALHPNETRIIAWTHRDLEAAIRTGGFSEDLYIRLHVLRIPPLRERLLDIPLLVERLCARHGQGPGSVRVSAGAIAALRSRAWPGNLHELESVVRRALVLAGRLDLEAVDFFPEDAIPDSGGILLTSVPAPSYPPIRQLERCLIEDALLRTRGNRTRAAAIVGISVRTLRNKLRIYRHSDGADGSQLREPDKPS